MYISTDNGVEEQGEVGWKDGTWDMLMRVKGNREGGPIVSYVAWVKVASLKVTLLSSLLKH